MNERFNELRLDAGIALLHNEPLLVVVNKDGTVNQCPLEGLEKFAELIVAECMEVFSKDLPEPGDGRMLEVINRVCDVAEHFGV